MSRRSVRKYSDKTIEDSLLENCIKNALYGTPTVCNRPINKVYVIKNYELTKGMVLLSINNKSCETMNYAEAMLYIQYLWKKKENIYLTFLRQKIKQNNSEVFEIKDNI